MIYTHGPWFKDEHGRTLLLRGINVGGSSKVPTHPDGATYRRENFFNTRNVSFVDRPFPLHEADTHFARLKQWGLDFVRFLVTWEAIEHAGPGCYDEAYLDYLYQIARKAAKYDINLFIDPHQDVWSRFSGGDGAPGWTFDLIGMDITHFAETNAAIVHATHGDPFPRMIWPTNGDKLAAATMFTLFFGGNDFAPQIHIEGEPIQDYLQRHYIQAIGQVAQRLRDLPNVIGYDTLNEPLAGYIGCPDLRRLMGELQLGEAPTPFQSMVLGEGLPQTIGYWMITLIGPLQVGWRRLNPRGTRAWKTGNGCIWRQHGVWDCDARGKPHLLRPDYFAATHGQPVHFHRDYFLPFARRYAEHIRKIDPKAILFVEGIPARDEILWGPDDPGNIVHAAHWYDSLTLITKWFVPWLTFDVYQRQVVLGATHVKRAFRNHLAAIKNITRDQMGEIPVLIGEFGIPFDLYDGQAYRHGDYTVQTQALDYSFQAIEKNLLSATLWNYTADNNHAHGDQWNDEDLSLFSPDGLGPTTDLNAGGRALAAAVRPYARAVAGEPLAMAFDLQHRRFTFEFRHDPALTAPTEFFIPALQYPQGYQITLSDGEYQRDEENQRLLYRHSLNQPTHHIEVKP